MILYKINKDSFEIAKNIMKSLSSLDGCQYTINDNSNALRINWISNLAYLSENSGNIAEWSIITGKIFAADYYIALRINLKSCRLEEFLKDEMILDSVKKKLIFNLSLFEDEIFI